MLISLISRSLNCAFRSVAIFVLLKKGLPAKRSKIKHSFSSSMIFFLPDPGWRLMSPVSFSCLLFLLVVLSERPRVSNCAIFEIDIPIWFRVDNSWSFCFILDLAIMFVFFILMFVFVWFLQAHQLVEWNEVELLFFLAWSFSNASSSSFWRSKCANSWEVKLLSEFKSRFCKHKIWFH